MNKEDEILKEIKEHRRSSFLQYICLILFIMSLFFLSGCFSASRYHKEIDERGYTVSDVVKNGHLFRIGIDYSHPNRYFIKHNDKECENHDWQEEIARFIE